MNHSVSPRLSSPLAAMPSQAGREALCSRPVWIVFGIHIEIARRQALRRGRSPFATTAARDPVTAAEGSILDRARALGAIPKLFYVNNSSEY